MNNDYLTSAYLDEAIRRYESEAEFHSWQSPRYRMKYVRWPSKSTTPLVFIHGMSDQVRSFAMVMREMVDRGYSCIGYELADGRDGAKLGTIQHQDYVADLIAFLDHLQLSQVDLVGSSFGTTIALRTMAMHPERVNRCILKGGFARRPLERWQRGLSRLGRYWYFSMSDLVLRETVLERFEKEQFIGCPDAVFRFLLNCSGTTPCRAAARRTLLIDKLDLRSLLPSIMHSVLMIGGDRDTIVPRWCEREVEQALPNVRRHELSECGHYPQYTRPRQTTEAMAEFLALGKSL